MIKLAQEIATKAHAGQYDKAGIEYINHPKAVVSQVKTDEEKIVAWLHDVCEDTDVTLDDLRNYGFSEAIVSAVDSITKRKGEAYDKYISRVKANPIAKQVKIADLRHNSDRSRVSNPDERMLERWNKYKKILAELTE